MTRLIETNFDFGLRLTKEEGYDLVAKLSRALADSKEDEVEIELYIDEDQEPFIDRFFEIERAGVKALIAQQSPELGDKLLNIMMLKQMASKKHQREMITALRDQIDSGKAGGPELDEMLAANPEMKRMAKRPKKDG